MMPEDIFSWLMLFDVVAENLKSRFLEAKTDDQLLTLTTSTSTSTSITAIH
jgi:hypothetical protein